MELSSQGLPVFSSSRRFCFLLVGFPEPFILCDRRSVGMEKEMQVSSRQEMELQLTIWAVERYILGLVRYSLGLACALGWCNMALLQREESLIFCSHPNAES